MSSDRDAVVLTGTLSGVADSPEHGKLADLNHPRDRVTGEALRDCPPTDRIRVRFPSWVSREYAHLIVEGAKVIIHGRDEGPSIEARSVEADS